MKNYKKGSTFVIVVLVVLVVGYIVFNLWHGNKKKEYEAKPSVQEITLSAVEKNNVALCETIDSFTRGVGYCAGAGSPCPGVSQIECRLEVASAHKNISICDSISDSYYKYQCYAKSSANYQADYKRCDSSQSMADRQSCYNSFAIGAKDPLICLKQSDDESAKGICLVKYAGAVRDVKICDSVIPNNISSTTLARSYQNRCYSHIAEELKDSSICSKITVENDKTICINRVQTQ